MPRHVGLPRLNSHGRSGPSTHVFQQPMAPSGAEHSQTQKFLVPKCHVQRTTMVLGPSFGAMQQTSPKL